MRDHVLQATRHTDAQSIFSPIPHSILLHESSPLVYSILVNSRYVNSHFVNTNQVRNQQSENWLSERFTKKTVE